MANLRHTFILIAAAIFICSNIAQCRPPAASNDRDDEEWSQWRANVNPKQKNTTDNFSNIEYRARLRQGGEYRGAENRMDETGTQIRRKNRNRVNTGVTEDTAPTTQKSVSSGGSKDMVEKWIPVLLLLLLILIVVALFSLMIFLQRRTLFPCMFRYKPPEKASSLSLEQDKPNKKGRRRSKKSGGSGRSKSSSVFSSSRGSSDSKETERKADDRRRAKGPIYAIFKGDKDRTEQRNKTANTFHPYPSDDGEEDTSTRKQERQGDETTDNNERGNRRRGSDEKIRPDDDGETNKQVPLKSSKKRTVSDELARKTFHPIAKGRKDKDAPRNKKKAEDEDANLKEAAVPADIQREKDVPHDKKTDADMHEEKKPGATEEPRAEQMPKTKDVAEMDPKRKQKIEELKAPHMQKRKKRLRRRRDKKKRESLGKKHRKRRAKKKKKTDSGSESSSSGQTFSAMFTEKRGKSPKKRKKKSPKNKRDQKTP